METNESPKPRFTINSGMQVETLKHDFLEEFGLGIRVYKRYGRQFADDEVTLAAIRNDEFKGAEFSPDSNSTISTLQDKIMELFGFKVEICGSNGHLCDDDLTLANAYKIDREYVDGYEIVNEKDISDSHESHAQNESDDDYQQEFEIIHQNFSDSVDNGIITFEQYDNAGAIMCALYPDETRSINIEEGELDEDADLDDIGGTVMRDMLFEAVEDKALFIKDYKQAIKFATSHDNHLWGTSVNEAVEEIMSERDR
jgi:hypothetical protein